MNRKLRKKLLLDLAMLLLFVLLLHKMNFGLVFHEIAGLSILGAFLLHLIWNRRWICSVTKRFFGKNLGLRSRISWLLNLALLLCFAGIGISGILISKVVFSFSAAGGWKMLHYFCTALAMLLLGVHLGLHAKMLGMALKKALHLPQKGAAILAACLTLAMVCLGAYSAATGSFFHWLTMPVQAQMQTAPAAAETRPALDAQTGSTPYARQGAQQGGRHGASQQGAEHDFARRGGDGQGRGGLRAGMDGMPQSGALAIVQNALQDVSVVYLFAAVTALLERFFTRGGRGERPAAQPALP